MIVALVKDGMVVNKIAVQDGVTLVQLAENKDANIFDLYDGKAFKVNPDAANLKVQAQKKQAVLQKIQKMDVSDAMISSVDAVVNPKGK